MSDISLKYLFNSSLLIYLIYRNGTSIIYKSITHILWPYHALPWTNFTSPSPCTLQARCSASPSLPSLPSPFHASRLQHNALPLLCQQQQATAPLRCTTSGSRGVSLSHQVPWALLNARWNRCIALIFVLFAQDFDSIYWVLSKNSEKANQGSFM